VLVSQWSSGNIPYCNVSVYQITGVNHTQKCYLLLLTYLLAVVYTLGTDYPPTVTAASRSTKPFTFYNVHKSLTSWVSFGELLNHEQKVLLADL